MMMMGQGEDGLVNAGANAEDGHGGGDRKCEHSDWMVLFYDYHH